MRNPNRDYSAYRDDTDYDTRDRRDFDRRSDRGYGEDYRGYTRGYNLDREPSYRSEYDAGYSGYGAQYNRDYGRVYSDTGRSAGRESFYGQGPSRSHLRCRDIMTRNVMTCASDSPVQEVARIMRDEDVGAIPVINAEGKLEGIVTDRDLVVRGLTSGANEADLRAKDCMSDDLYTANQNDRVVEVIDEMGDHQVRRVPVVDNRNRLVGIVSMADVALMTDKDLELKEALESISKPSSWFGRLANLFS